MNLGHGIYVDGSWELSILVEDLQVSKRIRVSGDIHIGGVMLKLVEAIDVKLDWSDHGLWWPERNCWLLKTRQTLDPKRLSSSSSSNRRSDAFNPLVPKPPTVPYGNGNDSLVRSPGSPRLGGGGPDTPPYNLMSPVSINSLAFEGADESYLANSPHVSLPAALEEKGLRQPRSFVERALLSITWLDSSKSLMEQGVRPGTDEELLLRFKYFAFYDLNIKYDAIRINQIYEQAKWSLLTEELDCTDEEMLLLAGLQLQVHLQANEPGHNRAGDLSASASAAAAGAGIGGGGDEDAAADDEIDAALADLEMSLMSDATSTATAQPPPGSRLTAAAAAKSEEVREVPELTGYLKFFKPKKFTLRNYKKYYFVLRETTLYMFSDRAAAGIPASFSEAFNLKNAEVVPDLNMTTRKFGIRLFILASTGLMQEAWLRCETKDQYAQWMSAIGLAARGKTLASRSLFDREVKETLTRLDMQAPKPQPLLTLDSMPRIEVVDFVAARFLKKHKSRALLQGILERHANVRSMNLLEAKLEYIRTWQRLPMHGVAYFVAYYTEARAKPMTFSEFRKERRQKEELFGVAFNRIMRLDLQTGDAVNTWRYHELDSWTVNWEVMSLRVSLNRPPHEMTLSPCAYFASKLAVCKTLAEMIGGYVFLSLRKPERSQELNEQMFHKLTGSRDHLT